jgi:hypothetical protein
VVPLEDVELLEELEERADLRAWRRAREEVRRKGTIPWKRLRKELRLDSSDASGDPESRHH